MIVESIKKHIGEVLGGLGIHETDFVLEHPDEISHGDYSTNVALVFGKMVKMKPGDLAEEIASKLKEKNIKDVDTIEIAGPGFINFFLTNYFFSHSISEINSEKIKNGKTAHLKGKKIFFEYTQPNPFKEFHIGHLMNNVIGEATSRILESNGAEVKRATYHGDVGIHVAKTLWGFKNLGFSDKEMTIESLGNAYARGNNAYESNEKTKSEIVALNKVIYEKSDSEINTLYERGRNISLTYFESIYKRLGSSFDFHFFESESAPFGKEIVLKNIDNDVFEKSEGAVVFKGERHGLHTRVFLNSEGLPTYEAKEIGLMEQKREKYKFDLSITVTANEQNDFFKVVEKAIGEIFPAYDGKIKHLSHGILKLTTGKMSSREGTVVSADSLIADVKKKVHEKIKDRGFDAKTAEDIVEKVAIGAIKYSILKQAVGSDIIFDFEKSLSFEGDSGPYLQYSYVRAKSILKKALDEKINDSGAKPPETRSATLLEKVLYRFPEIVERAGREYAPNLIATYLTELASHFNAFYANEQIVSKDDPASPYKIAITEAFSITMKNGLQVLGIEVPEKM